MMDKINAILRKAKYKKRDNSWDTEELMYDTMVIGVGLILLSSMLYLVRFI